MKDRVLLSRLSPDSWTPEHDVQLANFVRDSSQQLMTIFQDARMGLTVMDTFPTSPVEEIAYFIRKEKEVVCADNFSRVVQFGSVSPENVIVILRTLHGMYAPMFFGNRSWPDSILIHALFVY